jgi:hypothetical protein
MYVEETKYCSASSIIKLSQSGGGVDRGAVLLEPSRDLITCIEPSAALIQAAFKVLQQWGFGSGTDLSPEKGSNGGFSA